MARLLDQFFAGFRRKSVPPTETAGVPGVAVHGGFIQSDEKNANLSSREERFKTYSEILANTSIVAAGIRYFLNMTSKAGWTFDAADHPEGERLAKLAQEALTKDPRTPWHRIVRRAAMYRFYGFSVQEWTAKRREDGVITFSDIAPRAQLTIERWDLEDDGNVLGITQRNPQTAEEIYLPRKKLLYMVDDTLSDSPEGLGIFRHLVAPAQRLLRYEQLEGFGFETDLRGIPIGRGPFTDLAAAVVEGRISAAQRKAIEAPIRKFVQNHIKTGKLGLLLDSITYESKDEAGRASNAKQWEVELLKGSATSFQENAAAIERINRELARVLGVEQLLLGSNSSGSFSLSRDKTNAFLLLIDGALQEIKETVEDDLLGPLWELNGWPKEAMPTIKTEPVRFADVEQVATVLRDMALAGASLAPDDPAVNEVRDLMGIPRVSEEMQAQAAIDAALGAELIETSQEEGNLV